MAEQQEVFDWGGYPDLHEDWGGDEPPPDTPVERGCAWYFGALTAAVIVFFMVLAVALGIAAVLGIVLWVIASTWGALLD